MQNVFLDQISTDNLRDFDRFSRVADAHHPHGETWRYARLSFVEACVLSLQTYIHWVFLTVSAAVIVTRAMRPQVQVVWAQDCVVDGDELVIRAKVVRGSVSLMNTSFKLCCLRYGRCVPLQTAMQDSYPAWNSYTPINIRHTIDRDSPFHPSNGDPQHIICVWISINGQDASGLPIASDMECWNFDTIMAPSVQRLKSTERDFGLRFGRMFCDCKYKDCLTFLMDDPTNPVTKDGLIVDINLDNFSRIVKSSASNKFLTLPDAGGVWPDQVLGTEPAARSEPANTSSSANAAPPALRLNENNDERARTSASDLSNIYDSYVQSGAVDEQNGGRSNTANVSSSDNRAAYEAGTVRPVS
ncbi:unnamed protein product [Amoebophrya sp. A120]|nr:unnamed protein product [Amoebophrya sp. A120]|eukprot:GSA120T00001485001.1